MNMCMKTHLGMISFTNLVVAHSKGILGNWVTGKLV